MTTTSAVAAMRSVAVEGGRPGLPRHRHAARLRLLPAALVAACFLAAATEGFLGVGRPGGRHSADPYRRFGGGRSAGGDGTGNGGNDPPCDGSFRLFAHGDGPDPHDTPPSLHCATVTWGNGTRGGSSSASTNPADNVVKGTQATLAATASYWSRALSSAQSALARPFRAVAQRTRSLFQSPQQRKQVELLRQLQTLPVQRVVIADNATVLPPEVVQRAAQRHGLLGEPLRSDRVQRFAEALRTWYDRNGFVLHAVTGATLNAHTATAEVAVREPRAARVPVQIDFRKEMIVDPESGRLMTPREYRAHHQQRRSFGFSERSAAPLTSAGAGDGASLTQPNRTLIPARGRTDPRRIAAALGLRPLAPFRWDARQWRQVQQSGIFGTVFRAEPVALPDGTVQLQVLATEAPARHLEYGVGRSLYSGAWEGALEFEHANVLGGAERLAVSLRRGTKDAAPSARVSFRDDKFGRPGGYECELFSEYIGNTDSHANDNATSTSANVPAASGPTTDDDPTLNRRGTAFRIHNKGFRRSTTTVSVEQTVTQSGQHENIASSTLNLGPFVKELPLEARANVDFAVTTGTRMVDGTQQRPQDHPQQESEDQQRQSLLASKSFLPYSSITATTRQIFPLSARKSEGADPRPMLLALRHSITASTQHLPRHVAKAQGMASSIRGFKISEELSKAVQGTVEIRIPVTTPLLKTQIQQDASVIVFGDWLYASKEKTSPFLWRSSMGVGLRKTVKGFPIKLDLCYSSETAANSRYKLQPQIGLGGDFVV